MTHDKTDDYLWDKSGPPDPFVAELEEVLGPLAHTPGPRLKRRSVVRSWAWPIAGAAALLLAIGVSLVRPSPSNQWHADSLAGAPRLADAPLAGSARWALGAWLETDADSRAQISSKRIGWIKVNPGSKLKLTSADDVEHRLELAEGSIDAVILSPPRVFIVDTPAVTAVDMGCAYTLDIDDVGNGEIQVTAGWVYLERPGAPSAKVPAGAGCSIASGRGAGTPRFRDASPTLIDALDRFDAGAAEALEDVLAAARRRDSLSVWHVAIGTSGDARRQAISRLDDLVVRPRSLPTGPDLTDGQLERWWPDVVKSW